MSNVPASPFSRDGGRLLLLGFATLVLELALIRFLAGNIWNLGYFPNLVLLAVFLGMGAGFVFHHRLTERASTALYHAAMFTLAGLAALLYFRRPAVPGVTGSGGEVGGELFLVFKPTALGAADYAAFVLCFVAVTAVFFLVAQRTAKLFRLFRPLTAYSLDIVGSCLGITAFVGASFLRLPPAAWFAAFIAAFILAAPDSKRFRLLPLIPGLIVVLCAQLLDAKHLAAPEYRGPVEVRWSPYQRLEYLDGPRVPEGLRRSIWANGIAHQRIGDAVAIRNSFYQMPYDDRGQMGLPPIGRALVIGAGSGNDTAAALLNGVAQVDAVEIDPVIAGFGRRHHPLQPYSDPRVNLVVDDGRAFMTRATPGYDLVVFAWADSLVRAGSLSQLRLENFLFTEQAISRAYELLSPAGCLYVYNSYPQPWVGEKIRAMIGAAAGAPPKVVFSSSGDYAYFKVGRPAGCRGETAAAKDVEPPTDDWPFLHLRRHGVPTLYQKALTVVGLFVALLIVGVQALERRRPAYGGSTMFFAKLAFALMGAAFLLLETKSVIQFSLLFGATWLNNSLVFLGVLVLVLAANWAATALRGERALCFAFVLLLIACLAPLAYPLGNLLAVQSRLARFVAASLLTFSPIFFANLIFSLAFRDQQVPEHVFGWNLVGATIGGLAEYASMAIGCNRLAIVVAICYAAAFAALLAARRGATRNGLARESGG